MQVQTKRLPQIFAIVLLFILLIACYYIVKPFLVALVLGLVLAISSWPAFQWLVEKWQFRPSRAALLLSLSFLVLFAMPFALLGGSLGANFSELRGMIEGVAKNGLPEPPEFLKSIPWVGENLYEKALQFSQTSSEKVFAFLRPHLLAALSWMVSIGASLGFVIVQFLIAVGVAFLFLRDAGALSAQLRNISEHIVGTRTEKLIEVSTLTLRGVVYGILGTAVIQAILAAMGFFFAGVPGAALLAFAVFFLSLVPVGPPLIWIPATFYVFQHSSLTVTIVFLLWNVLVVSGADNFVKPYLISRGSPLPLLLVLVGVIGGAIAYGFLGLFLGPTLLALAYALLREWAVSPKNEKSTTPV